MTAASLARVAQATLFINGKKVATGRIERTITITFDVETANVGVDLYTPVTTDYQKGDNKFTGKIDKVTIDEENESCRRRDCEKRS
jgi:arylsulfatase